jgi:predicted nucleic acid-binding protein
VAAITHILDTSAILAHYFGEPGAAEVDAVWRQKGSAPAICVLTIPELRTRLQAEIGDPAEVERAFDLYVNHLTSSVPVDRATAEAAMQLRQSSSSRLPLVDACIAGCARQNRCVLVHRDPHLDGLPAGAVRQLRLPDKAR